MPSSRGLICCLALLAMCTACDSSDESPPGGANDAGVDGQVEAGLPDVAEEAFVDAAEDGAEDALGDVADADPVATVTILHTASERGAVLPNRDGTTIFGGAANVAGWWKQVEGYAPDTHLVLTGGNSWLGAYEYGATSTWLEGENTVAIMNAMGYRVATLGARDYDFTRDVLTTRIAEAAYPFVAANTLYADTGDVVDYVSPYEIVEVDGVRVAVIGLMLIDHDVNPARVLDLTFAEYVPTVEKHALDARAKGADVVVLLTSVPAVSLSASLGSLVTPVDAIFAGGSYFASSATLLGDAPLVASGGFWKGYHRVEIDVDRATRHVLDRRVTWVDVSYEEADGNPVTPDAEVEALVDQWEATAATELEREIGYVEGTVLLDSPASNNWVVDAWMWAYPHADMALQNDGGVKISIQPGPITVDMLVSGLPHPNYILEATMTGAQVVASLEGMIAAGQGGPVAGIRYETSPSGVDVTLDDGTPLDPEATYTVLINDYMYAGQAGFPYDPELPVVPTGAHYRDPVIAWTEQLGTSASDPLDNYLDPLPRGQ